MEIRWAKKEDYEDLFSIGISSEKLYLADFIAYEYIDDVLEIYKTKHDNRYYLPEAIERITIEQAKKMTVQDFENKNFIIF